MSHLNPPISLQWGILKRLDPVPVFGPFVSVADASLFPGSRNMNVLFLWLWA